MKRFFLFLFILVLVCSVFAAWIFLGSATGFESPKKALYISNGAATKKAVMDSIRVNHIITNETAFEFLANRMDLWKNLRPGKYEFKKGASLLTIVRTIRNGMQTPVNLVITKIRTKEDFARLVGNKFECDSTQMLNFLNSADSLNEFETSPTLSMWHILPDTYTYTWNATPSSIYRKIYNESKKFWDEEREQKAKAIGLSPSDAYILASIIEEETTNNAEKDTIASVYLNRLRIGMPLQADPTLKFAVKDFTIKRIAGDILDVLSPYNTYKNKGLPPGPICTPSRITIDKVLNPASTDYLYFVAKPKLGGHLYSASYEEHLKKRADYLAADKIRLEKEKNGGK